MVGCFLVGFGFVVWRVFVRVSGGPLWYCGLCRGSSPLSGASRE